MVATSRGTERAGALRRLNAPRPVHVRLDDDARTHGSPVAVRRMGTWTDVLEVLDCYRTDDRWWTSEPVSRTYYELLSEDGRTTTLFHDELHNTWYEQRYG